MPNNIALFQKTMTGVLDEVYKQSSLTSVLDGNPDLVREGANANELIIPKMDMDGLGDYDRNSGYVDGDVTLTNETVKCNFDRGRMFDVDVMDDLETAGTAYGRLAGEFMRTKVIPEMDAFRFASYAGASGISKVSGNGATLADGAAVLAALRAASNKMDEDEVPYEDRYLYITPTLDGMIADLDTTKSKEVMNRFAAKFLVPQTRFYTAIERYDGSSDGETAGGYVKAVYSADINFMILHRAALIQFSKHIAPKVVLPEANQKSDGYRFGYRHVAIAEVYENKVAGIYLHHKPYTAYTVTYGANGGTGTMAAGTAYAGLAFTLPACTFTPPEGKVFSAWSIGGESFDPGDTHVFTADTTVTAVWADA